MDFATLILAADSRSLKSGERDLDSIAATAEKTERRVNKATDGVSKGLNDIGKASTFANGQMRATSMQLSQVAQQASATGDWLQAVAIQLPDLALGLGPIGILAGAAAGALLPLAANFLTASGNAEELEDAMSGLKKATDSYADAVANSLMPAEDLIRKFGGQAESAGRVYDAMRKIAELDFTRSINNARSAMETTLQSLTESVQTFDKLSSMPRMATDGFDAFAVEVQRLSHEFGLTTEQAQRVVKAMDDLSHAQGPLQIAEAAAELGRELSNAVAAGAKLSPELENVQKDAYQASLDASKFASLTQAAVGPAQNLADAVSGVADQYARAAAIAATLTAKYPSQGTYDGIIRTGDGPIQGSSDPDLPMVGPVPGSRGTPELSGFPWENFNRRSRGGGRSKKSDSDYYDDIVKSAERRIQTLEAERDAIGLTEQAADKLRYQTDLLNDAQEKGIKLSPEQRANLETLAETMARVEHETRVAQEQMDFFNDISDDLKDGFLDAIVEGEKLDDVFKDLAKSIAKAALEAALFGTGPFASGGGKGGGGGGFLTAIFGGLGKLFSFDGGGSTGPGSRSGGLDGKGGFMAMLHPNETVIDHTKSGNTAGGVEVSIVSRFLADGSFESVVEGISQKQVGRAAPGIVSAANQQVVPTMAKYQNNKAGADWR